MLLWKVTCLGVWFGLDHVTCHAAGCPMGPTLICIRCTAPTNLQAQNQQHLKQHSTEFSKNLNGKKKSNFHLRVHTQNVRPVPGWRAKSRTRRGSRPIQRHVISSFATSVASSAIVHATGNVEPVPKQLQTCYVWSVTPWIVQNMPFQDFTGAEFQRILKPPSGQHWRWPPKLFMGLESTLILQTKTKRLGQIGYWKPWIVPCNQYTAAWEELENLYRQFLNSLQITHPKILIFIESKILLWSKLTSLFQIFWSWCSTWLAFSSCLLPLIALKLRRWKTRSLDATAAWWWEEGTFVPSLTNIYPLDTRMKTLAPRLHLIPLWFRWICWYQLYGPRCVFRYALSLCPRRGWQIAPRSNTAVQKLWGCQIILISKYCLESRGNIPMMLLSGILRICFLFLSDSMLH